VIKPLVEVEAEKPHLPPFIGGVVEDFSGIRIVELGPQLEVTPEHDRWIW
jgi:hypothetical protein